MTPLFAALANRHFKVAECLLEKGANIDHNEAMMSSYTPLMQMVMWKKFSSVRFLVEQGAAIDFVSEGNTAYELAVKFSTPRIQKYLAEQMEKKKHFS